jgi:hypothetical protein
MTFSAISFRNHYINWFGGGKGVTKSSLLAEFHDRTAGGHRQVSSEWEGVEESENIAAPDEGADSYDGSAKYDHERSSATLTSGLHAKYTHNKGDAWRRPYGVYEIRRKQRWFTAL